MITTFIPSFIMSWVNVHYCHPGNMSVIHARGSFRSSIILYIIFTIFYDKGIVVEKSIVIFR